MLAYKKSARASQVTRSSKCRTVTKPFSESVSGATKKKKRELDLDALSVGLEASLGAWMFYVEVKEEICYCL
jgi:hypothetical protein